MADVIDFQGRHRPDLRKPWIFVSGIEETGQRAQLPPRWWKCRSWEGSVTGSCSFSLEIFLFLFFSFWTRYVWISLMYRSVSSSLYRGGRKRIAIRVWRCLTEKDDVWGWCSFRRCFFFICLDFEIIFARIWLCFAFEDFELFSSNCKETIELKNVKWFSNDFLWFKESEKNRYVKINIF